MQIYKFNSILKRVLWGGNKLVPFKGLPPQDVPIGESWELSALPGKESVVADGPDRGLTLNELVQRYGADLVGEDVWHRYGNTFPLLIKLIDAKRDLSIQVHPGDEQAMRDHGCKGKTEMWYILDADEGATITTGFNKPITPQVFDRSLVEGTILDVVNRTVSKPGDVFFIPSGQIHSIGAGNLLVEVQQSSDITYRVFDYNRRDADGKLRELHTTQAREALHYDVVDSKVSYGPVATGAITPMLSCPEFDVRLMDILDCNTIPLPAPHSFVALVCITGETTVTASGMASATLRRGMTALVPAAATSIAFIGSARLLAVTVPASENNHQDQTTI